TTSIVNPPAGRSQSSPERSGVGSLQRLLLWVGREHAAERVHFLGVSGDPRAVLGEMLAAGASQARGRTVDYHHGASADEATDGLARDAHGNVGETVGVEVADGERITEYRGLCGVASRAVLGEQLAARAGQPHGATVEHIHRAGVIDAANV